MTSPRPDFLAMLRQMAAPDATAVRAPGVAPTPSAVDQVFQMLGQANRGLQWLDSAPSRVAGAQLPLGTTLLGMPSFIGGPEGEALAAARQQYNGAYAALQEAGAYKRSLPWEHPDFPAAVQAHADARAAWKASAANLSAATEAAGRAASARALEQYRASLAPHQEALNAAADALRGLTRGGAAKNRAMKDILDP